MMGNIPMLRYKKEVHGSMWEDKDGRYVLFDDVRKMTIYVVWTLEDTDNVNLFLNEEAAEELFEEFGEFGMMGTSTIGRIMDDYGEDV
jgi:hypothetical protein